MNISFINHINFQAHKMDFKPRVLKRDDTTGEYRPEEVSMVEIDLMNPKDLEVLDELDDNWYNDNYMFQSNFIHDINSFAIDSAKHMKSYGKNYKFYAITTQKNDFENLKPEGVLSVCNVKLMDEMINLRYIQSNPESAYESCPTYNKCGTALVDGLKHYYKGIEVYHTEDAAPFYEVNEFNPDAKNHMTWGDCE